MEPAPQKGILCVIAVQVSVDISHLRQQRKNAPLVFCGRSHQVAPASYFLKSDGKICVILTATFALIRDLHRELDCEDCHNTIQFGSVHSVHES